MIVRTDLNLLRTRIAVPTSIQSATWIVVPLGTATGSAPGPTDTRLYAFLQPAPDALAPGGATFGPVGTARTETVPEAVAVALLPPTVLAGLVKNGDQRQVTGPSYNPTAFNYNPYRGLFAIQMGTGVLVCMQTN